VRREGNRRCSFSNSFFYFSSLLRLMSPRRTHVWSHELGEVSRSKSTRIGPSVCCFPPFSYLSRYSRSPFFFFPPLCWERAAATFYPTPATCFSFDLAICHLIRFFFFDLLSLLNSPGFDHVGSLFAHEANPHFSLRCFRDYTPFSATLFLS